LRKVITLSCFFYDLERVKDFNMSESREQGTRVNINALICK